MCESEHWKQGLGWARVVALATVLLSAAAMALTAPSSAWACSAGGDWDPIHASDVIIAGQILGYEALSAPLSTQPMMPIRLRMRIDHVYKGRIEPGEMIVDQRSLMLYTDETAGQIGRDHDWAGGSGGCGTIDHEPVGWYAVYGLSRGEDGWLTTNRLTTFYLREEPYDVGTFIRLNERLGMPFAGAGSARHPAFPLVITGMLLAGAHLTAAGLSARMRR